ncbi:ferrous iron transport protein B [uncultured Clostridium sp.]|uniref:ferrous iron transport protein B n=1 Tax=uncultured Clostridium sp. TaxID=59620 RepID=UPI0025EC3E2A|nr:ferrous iron transport protein B [uncultured Clostridium sp.]
MKLSDLEIGKYAVIESVDCNEISLRKHILDMGLTPGTEIKLVKIAPMGDPMEISVRGYELTLRKEDAEYIKIRRINKVPQVRKVIHLNSDLEDHPGVGEHKKYHVKYSGEKIPDYEIITFALAGNQNCGKTTLFNRLTGMNQHVGNFPGVTVDRKEGSIRNFPNAMVTDLPGIYSLSPYSSEEIVTREFLLKERPKGIINIIDATNIERNLYLTMQLIELDIPMVLALNMMDEVRQNGGTIMINRLEEMLGIPVIPISAAKNEGIDELIEHAVHVAQYGERPGRMDFCSYDGEDEGAVHRCIHAIIHLIEDHAKRARIPVRFAATKLVESDDIILEKLRMDENEERMLEHVIIQMEEESGKDRQAALADMRFNFIERLCEDTVVKPHESRERKRSQAIDKILTGKYTAIPTFLGIMGLIFFLTFGVFGKILSNLMDMGIDYIVHLCDRGLYEYGLNPIVHSLVIDGALSGVGSVLSFLPVIVVLFFFLSILEDSGYMARVAFIMDKPLRKIGLSGRSFVPMLIGFGCSVPAIMSTRTLPSDRDRKMTILLTPFMSCSAKLPIYALFTAAFFPRYGALVIISLYLLGIAAAVLFSTILKSTSFKGNPVPFVMELPDYRMPSAKSVLKLMGDKAQDFISRAFTIIFLASIIIWFLQSFDLKLNPVSDSSESLLALLGGILAPIFKPLGFADWRVSTALITGFTAKESVVSTLTVLLGGSTEAVGTLFKPYTAFVFLVFSLLYTPCVAAIAAVKRELGRRWTIQIVITQCAVAWVIAFLANLLGRITGVV